MHARGPRSRLLAWLDSSAPYRCGQTGKNRPATLKDAALVHHLEQLGILAIVDVHAD
jgi:hypothetical protein